MKRARETDGTHETTLASRSDAIEAASSSSKRNALDEIRAKLEMARSKKIAAEERLKQQQQQQQQQVDSKAKPKPSSTKEAQEALDRARSKLQGALQNRERALQLQQQQQQQQPSAATSTITRNRKRRQSYFLAQKPPRYNGLPPISALSPSCSLTISNIEKTGPPEMVYHYEDTVKSPFSTMGLLGSRVALEEALGGKMAIAALHKGHYQEYIAKRNRYHKNVANQNVGKTNNDTGANKKQKTLLQRKIQLQNELLALKEKLEKSSQEQKQKGNPPKLPTSNATQASKAKPIPTKEGLERRKAEAQTIMDISYWKHFVSKQEHLLEQVTTKLKDSESTHQTYKETRHATNKAIAQVQENLQLIEQRQSVVEDGMLSATENLLQARQALHAAKKQTKACRQQN